MSKSLKLNKLDKILIQINTTFSTIAMNGSCYSNGLSSQLQELNKLIGSYLNDNKKGKNVKL